MSEPDTGAGSQSADLDPIKQARIASALDRQMRKLDTNIPPEGRFIIDGDAFDIPSSS
jgi:hypothetical protein